MAQQDYYIQQLQRLPAFTWQPRQQFSGRAGESRPTAAQVIPDTDEWQCLLLCWLAAGENPELCNKFYVDTDYAEVWQFYTLRRAGQFA